MAGVVAWCTGDEVLERMGINADDTQLSAAKVDGYALTATEVLYVLSGRQFKGGMARTVSAPVGRMRSTGAYYRGQAKAIASLGPWFPVTAVHTVTGIWSDDTREAIDPADWEWSKGTILTVPGQWANQRVEVLIDYGQPPPASGKLAAQALAVELAINDPEWDGEQDTRLPQLVTSVSRQGISQSFATVLDVLKEGATGIHEVDQFLRTYNGAKTKRRAKVRMIR